MTIHYFQIWSFPWSLHEEKLLPLRDGGNSANLCKKFSKRNFSTVWDTKTGNTYLCLRLWARQSKSIPDTWTKLSSIANQNPWYNPSFHFLLLLLLHKRIHSGRSANESAKRFGGVSAQFLLLFLLVGQRRSVDSPDPSDGLKLKINVSDSAWILMASFVVVGSSWERSAMLSADRVPRLSFWNKFHLAISWFSQFFKGYSTYISWKK